MFYNSVYVGSVKGLLMFLWYFWQHLHVVVKFESNIKNLNEI